MSSVYCDNTAITGRTILIIKLLPYSWTSVTMQFIGMENIITGTAMKL